MKAFVQAFACSSRAHCRACRNDPRWRATVGAPKQCPVGVTADHLRPVTLVAQNRSRCPQAHRAGCGQPWTCLITDRECPHPHLPNCPFAAARIKYLTQASGTMHRQRHFRLPTLTATRKRT